MQLHKGAVQGSCAWGRASGPGWDLTELPPYPHASCRAPLPPRTHRCPHPSPHPTVFLPRKAAHLLTTRMGVPIMSMRPAPARRPTAACISPSVMGMPLSRGRGQHAAAGTPCTSPDAAPTAALDPPPAAAAPSPTLAPPVSVLPPADGVGGRSAVRGPAGASACAGAARPIAGVVGCGEGVTCSCGGGCVGSSTSCSRLLAGL